MATWGSNKRFGYKDRHTAFRPGQEHYFEWEYQSCADVLTIKNTVIDAQCAYTGKDMIGSVTEDLSDPEEAKALYRTLRNWVKRYYGDKVLASLDEFEE